MQNENISPDIKRMCKTPAEKKCARRGDQNSCLLMQNLLACMHNDYNHFFSAAVLFCCFSVAVEWVSEWTCFSTVCSFFVWHTRKKTGPVFWSLCAICKVVPIYTRFFSLETSTQFKFGFGWFFFCRLVRRHKMPFEAEGKTHFEWSGPFNSGHWTADSLHQMNTFVEHKWWPQNLCAWNYQYIQFADKYMNCIVNEFNLHENNREKKSRQQNEPKQIQIQKTFSPADLINQTKASEKNGNPLQCNGIHFAMFWKCTMKSHQFDSLSENKYSRCFVFAFFLHNFFLWCSRVNVCDLTLNYDAHIEFVRRDLPLTDALVMHRIYFRGSDFFSGSSLQVYGWVVREFVMQKRCLVFFL